MKRNIISMSLALALTASLSAAPTIAGNGPGKGFTKGPFVKLQLLGFNDYHGHVTTDAVGFRVSSDAFARGGS
jgi:hypothetical protein